MVPRQDSAATRRSILVAAQNIVTEQGVARLTLEAVAASAGVSKGALLYHFASKDDLVKGMITYHVEEFERLLQHFKKAESGSPGSSTRAYVTATVQSALEQGEAASALIAAVATNPDLLSPLRERFADWQSSVEEDGIDPARATVVRLAIDGWWLCELFGFGLNNDRLAKKVYAELMRLTRKE